jgi:hypothetical protein
MRKLLNDNKGNIGTIIMAVATAITIAISILICYQIIGSMNNRAIDANMRTALGSTNLNTQPAANATGYLVQGLGTFFTLSPIYIVVLVAVAIIGAVMGIMVVRRR